MKQQKLSLNRETLREVNHSELKRVRGGGIIWGGSIGRGFNDIAQDAQAKLQQRVAVPGIPIPPV